MKAIAITRAAAEGHNIPFLNAIELPVPTAEGHDLLVEVKAISVNPVDTKVRAGFDADTSRVLGWDAVGTVKAVGDAVTLFAPGDEVWYAGALGRPGSNAEFQLVDERIVALKPRSLDNASAAALRSPPSPPGNYYLTAWASRKAATRRHAADRRRGGRRWFHPDPTGSQANRDDGDRHGIAPGEPEMGAGRRRASVIDHNKPLSEELARIGVKEVTHVASLNNTEQHYLQLIDALAPQGKLALIDDPQTLDARPLKAKSISLHWEFMLPARCLKRRISLPSISC
ncbi:Zinc-type alcohol dehydrogenase-like protein SA1988 [Raoultella terrigena]|uniref:Zinc-type alcohol dehydrogenase-like protein SA1988 n=1 Tax=Raoultella terrigena TaxID=577 RepID=A0A4V6YW49_RAOTE|nr:Zinc-type alcohol dehydrogenase-like protein SA1988 [Raoultella terrigena]